MRVSCCCLHEQHVNDMFEALQDDFDVFEDGGLLQFAERDRCSGSMEGGENICLCFCDAVVSVVVSVQSKNLDPFVAVYLSVQWSTNRKQTHT